MTDQYPYLNGQELGWFNQALAYIQKPVKSYIYFVEARSEGLEPLVKIGLTIDPNRRLNEIWHDVQEGKYNIDWLALGVESLQMVGLLEGTQPLETALHKAFKPYKAGREWFWLTDELDQVIDALLDEYCVCGGCLIADGCDVIHNDINVHNRGIEYDLSS